MSKVKGRDIVELVAKDKGYKIKSKNFNKQEWYGFENDNGNTLRAKLIPSCDSKDNFNVHANDIENENVELLLAIIQTDSKFTIIEIIEFSNKKVIIKQQDNTNLILKTGIENKLNRQEYFFDDTIFKLENIEISNNAIYGIKQRVEDTTKIDEIAVKKLFDNLHECSYCGISREETDELNRREELTSRNRGRNMEVDQIIAKNGYVDGNIALTCYWCNNAKTDTFSVQEFKEIARGINIAWNIKIKAIRLNKTICFPENSDIWDK